MKKLFVALFILVSATASAQILNPVKLSYSAVKKGNNVYEIHIKAYLDPKWHIYSVYNPAGGADATTVKFKNADVTGKLKEEGKAKNIFESAFGVNQRYYETSVDFIQSVKVKPGEKKVKGVIEYEVCNDQKCLPPKEVEFEVKL